MRGGGGKSIYSTLRAIKLTLADFNDENDPQASQVPKAKHTSSDDTKVRTSSRESATSEPATVKKEETQALEITEPPLSPSRGSSSGKTYYEIWSDAKGLNDLNKSVITAAQKLAPERSKQLVAQLVRENHALAKDNPHLARRAEEDNHDDVGKLRVRNGS